ncbi:uncharacterized protein LOC122050185 [Zingiber officinale]|uniref:uncharacterized protein LOC122050185 n=1 Tax=Zingiber officinale TaxID=94328 RepID=UPI001C4D5502|nr:uncharacterized protein LOC122050185 [Zingiber officinale]
METFLKTQFDTWMIIKTGLQLTSDEDGKATPCEKWESTTIKKVEADVKATCILQCGLTKEELNRAADIIMDSVMAGVLKRKAATLEAMAAREMEALGIQPVSSREGESGTQAEPAAPSQQDVASGATPSEKPTTPEAGSAREEEQPHQKRRRVETSVRSATSTIHPSERVTESDRGKAPETETISSDQTPSDWEEPAAPVEAIPISILPPARYSTQRSTIHSQFSAPTSDPLPTAGTTPGRGRTVRVTLHLPTEELLPEADRRSAHEHTITMKGPLAEMWADARARVAMIPLSKLADSHMEQATGRWVEEIVVSSRLAEVEAELKQLKASNGPSGSLGPTYAELQRQLKETQDQLTAEQKKTADQAHYLAESERKIKSLDQKLTLATTRKNTAISDLEKKNVEARGLEQKVKELMEQLDAEKTDRSADAAKQKEELKQLQEALTASQATFKEYQEGEPTRAAALRQGYIRSPAFFEKICERMYTAFDLAMTATTNFLKSKGQLPEYFVLPAKDQAAVLNDIPTTLYDYLE